jgi:hypothetical protein
VRWLFWAPLIAVLLHIIEEFAWPGGFLAWYRRYRPWIAKSLTVRFAVIVNGVLILACLCAGVFGRTPRGAALWLTVAAVLLSNVGFHVLASVQTRGYSPGVITAVLLYLPLAAYGYWSFVHAGLASWSTAVTALLLGLSYPIFSLLNHRRRATARRI